MRSAHKTAGAYVRRADGSWALRDEEPPPRLRDEHGAEGDMPLACMLRSISAEETLRPPPQPQHRPEVLPSASERRSQHPRAPVRTMSLPRSHGSSSARARAEGVPPPPMLRRQKGVERSAEDLAASITAAHAMLGLNPEPALAQLGISPVALEAIMKQRSLGRGGAGAPPPPSDARQQTSTHPPPARRTASFKPRARELSQTAAPRRCSLAPDPIPWPA